MLNDNLDERVSPIYDDRVQAIWFPGSVWRLTNFIGRAIGYFLIATSSKWGFLFHP